DVAAYAVMSNHYHIVLAIQKDEAMAWSTREVIERWHRLYSGTHLTREFLAGKNLEIAELESVEDKAEIWRERLYETSMLLEKPIMKMSVKGVFGKGVISVKRY
ncbi:MAG: hypothetical protein MJK11_20825, partial [Pseudomonadales bacterium]|nr:hypothetical protein [Pseudomonadales bacterium]